MAETTWKVGEKCRGRCAGVSVKAVAGKPVSDDVNLFEGIVIEVEAAEDSDTGDELVTVKYTKPSEWDRIHGEKTGCFTADELQPL